MFAVVVAVAAIGIALFYWLKSTATLKNQPPTVPYLIPFIGSMLEFGMNPLGFLQKQSQVHGDVFTFLMFGKRMTYLLGPDGNNFVLNACKLKEVSAEEAYKHLTTPVFGPGVVYDVENHVLMEQKRFVKHGLSTENLRLYVSLIEQETVDYFARWQGASGSGELTQAIAELTIMTASRCLMGKEIRMQLSDTVAELYNDLDKGFTPLNFLFPSLPLESYRKRDLAHIKMRDLFLSIMKERRGDNDMDNQDMLQALMSAEYKDGVKMTDAQHTSSTTGSWLLSYLAENPACLKKLKAEISQVMGDDLSVPLDYDALKEMTYLENCVNETLRLKPPIIVLMRKAMDNVKYRNFVIPKGNYVCVSPALAQLDKATWGDDVLEFNPDRFLPGNTATKDAIGHGATSSYLPFGAGRHRCIGEAFANIQLKTIIATFVRNFDFGFADGQAFPKVDYTTLIVMPVKPVMLQWNRVGGKGSVNATAEMEREE